MHKNIFKFIPERFSASHWGFTRVWLYSMLVVRIYRVYLRIYYSTCTYNFFVNFSEFKSFGGNIVI